MYKEYKSYSRIYWISWFILTSVFVSGKIFKIYLLKDIPFNIYFVGIFFVLIVIHAVVGVKLINYLEKNHSEKWDELTAIPFLNKHFGQVRWSGYRVIKFLYSKEAFNDPILFKLKDEKKKIFLLCIVHFIFIPILIVVLAILRIKGFIVFNVILYLK